MAQTTCGRRVMATKLIKDVYTEYLSGSVVVTPPASNIEFIAGSAEGGQLLTRYTISDKDTARQLFRGGELLKALLERLDAGSSMIYAVRIGDAQKASLLLKSGETDVINIEAVEPGSIWNAIEIDLTIDGAARTIEITNPETENSDAFTGDSNDALVEAINNGQSLVRASKIADDVPDAIEAQVLSGGTDGATLTNGDYIDAIEFSEQFSDVSWVHFVGADTPALWTAIVTSCQTMIDNVLGERFALLDFPRFTALDPDHPTLQEVQEYVDNCIALKEDFTNRNAVFFIGEGKFIDSNGEEYINRLVSACSGKMASVPLQKSLLGESPTNIISLIPEFSRGQQVQLIQANINYLRTQPGIGKIIALSNNAPPTGETYNRIEKLRAVYSAGKQARIAAFPHLGRPNDEGGEGLKLLEEDIKRPLELMMQKGEIDSYELLVTSSDEMRTLGEAQVTLSVNSMKAFEIILSKIYLD